MFKGLSENEARRFIYQIQTITDDEVTVKANSEWIELLKYNFNSGTATMILTTGKDYDFPSVSERLFWDWAQSRSAGKFYNKNIRDLHYQKLVFKLMRAMGSAKKAISRFLKRGGKEE